MAGERYVVLGLARPRTEWFTRVSHWATSAAVPADFIKCVSAEDLRAKLRSQRPFSAALLDGGLPAVDRDLIATLADAGVVPIVVDPHVSTGADPTTNWSALGAAEVVGEALEREQLIDVLATHASPIVSGQAKAVPEAETPVADVSVPAPVIAVTGPGGTGASTVAVALAQGLADPEQFGEHVLLADLCLRAEQAMLHDAPDVFPGLQELVEQARSQRPSPAQAMASAHAVEQRGYHLLLGLRRAAYWTTIRPRAFEVAFDSLRAAFNALVCDVDLELESEAESGSIDIEERNVLSRTAVKSADTVVVVGSPSMKGMHALVRSVGDVLAAGVAPERILPVINMVAKKAVIRNSLTYSFGTLVEAFGVDRAVASPVFLPPRRIDEALRDGVPVPEPLPETLAGAVQAMRGRLAGDDALAGAPEPERVQPGSFGLAMADLDEGTDPDAR